MSVYEWETGNFKLSTAAYAEFKKAYFEQYNQAFDYDYNLALQFLNDLLEKAKETKATDLRSLAQSMVYDTKQTSSRSYQGFLIGNFSREVPRYPFKVTGEWELIRNMFEVKDESGKVSYRKTPLKIKKSWFTPLSPSKTLTICDKSGGDASITFDPKERTLHWNVSENNHACDRARESFMGKIFFDLLSKVEWTRATGGYIWGKNEYDEDAERESFTTPSCRTKECYGPIGEAHKKELRKSRGF